MKILLFGILLFTFVNIASAQPIFIPLKGERAITRVKDIKKEDVDIDITKMGKPCGEYFLYDEVKDTDGSFKHLVSFKVPVTNQDANTSFPQGFIRASFNEIIIKLEDKIETPTAEWSLIGPIGREHLNYIIRISHKALLEANCLSPS